MRAKSEAAKASSMAALLVRIESGNASIKRIESDFQPILIDLAEQDGPRSPKWRTIRVNHQR